MRKIILTLIVIVFNSNLNAQNTSLNNQIEEVFNDIQNKFKSKLKEYRYDTIPKFNQILSEKTAHSYIQPTFTNLLTGNSNLISSQTAGTITLSGESSTLGFNYAYGNKSKTRFTNFGIITESKGNTISIFSPDSWSTGLGLNFGVSLVLTKPKLTFDETDFKKLAKRRQSYVNQRLSFYNSLLTQNRDNNFDKFLDSVKNPLEVTFLHVAPDILAELELRRDSIQKIKDLVWNILSKRIIDSIIQNDLDHFDMQNIVFKGYAFYWLNISGGYKNFRTKLYDSSIVNNNLLAINKSDFNRFNINIQLNYLSNQPNYLWFWNAGINFYNTNFLTDRTIEQLPFIKVNNISDTVIVNDKGEEFGKARDLKRNIWVFQPYGQIGYLPNKQIGVAVKASWQNGFHTPNNVWYNNTFNACLGLIFRAAKDEVVSKGTIGIDAGFFNTPFNSRVWKDHFSVRIFAGIPLNIKL